MPENFEQLPGDDLAQIIRRASAYLMQHGIEQGDADAQLLAAHCLTRESGEDISRGRVHMLALVGHEVPAGFVELVQERAKRVPLQHLTGVAFFRNLELRVGPGVFVPRPETEELVSSVLTYIDKRSTSPLKIVDLCTGSGAIAAAIAQERPGHDVRAVELSELAYAWAQQNLRDISVQLILHDATTVFATEAGTFDVVASNPPYIPTNAVPKDPEVRDHDPQMALYGGSEDGMKIPDAIAAHAFDLLKPGGYFIVEHAETQRDLMVQSLKTHGFIRIESKNDLSGRARHTLGLHP